MNYTKTELYAIHRVWDTIAGDRKWSSFDAFVEWAEGKYKTGFTVYKLREDLPHSPENSYWYYHTRKPENTVSPFCAGCTEIMRVCNVKGCFKYRETFVKNWNENICRKPKEVKEEPIKREFFQYEHPDLVREGIVWTT